MDDKEQLLRSDVEAIDKILNLHDPLLEELARNILNMRKEREDLEYERDMLEAKIQEAELALGLDYGCSRHTGNN